MRNRRDIQEAVKASQARNSQNMQWIGQVVSADATGGLCLVNVRGKIVSCVVPAGTQMTYGAQVSVSRLPGQARLVVNAGGNTTIVNQLAAPASTASSGGGGSVEPPSITPDIPQELEAMSLSETAIGLEWSSTGKNTANYLIERSPTVNLDDFEWIATVSVEETVYTDTGLAPATQYWYRVRAKNKDIVSAYSNVATATTSVGETVTLVSIQDLGVNNVLVPSFRLNRIDDIGINNIKARLRLDRIDDIDALSENLVDLLFASSPVLDSFNRADTYPWVEMGEPIGLSWVNVAGPINRGLSIEGGQCSDGHHYYSNGWGIWLVSYAPDCAISITIANWGFTESGSVKLGFTNEFRNPDGAGYSAYYLEDGTYITVYNLKDGQGAVHLSLTVPGVGAPTYHITDPQNGDEIGVAIVDGVVTAGYKPVGGSWIAALTSAATSPYPYETVMYPWIRMSGLSVHPMRIDDFCGGAIA
jgi:hypothetical protein